MRAETIRIIAGATLMLVASPAGAQTPLTAFNGQWSGTGTDRETPLQFAQRTRCQGTVKADPTHLASDTECNGEAGLTKRFRLAVAFDGAEFTGKVEQTSRQQGGAPRLRAGTVTGRRTGDTADFTVRFPGLTPNAYVALRLISPTSFSMRVSSLGVTLTDVTYRRPAAQ